MSAPAQRFLGYVEVLGSDRVTGWCVNLDAPQQPVELELVAQGRVLAHGRTSLDRPDVAREIGSHRLCGFAVALGAAGAGIPLRELRVRPVGSSAALPGLEGLYPETPLPEPAGPAAAPAASALPPPIFPALHAIDPAAAEALLAQPFPLERPPLAAGTSAPLQGRLLAVEQGEARGWARRRQAEPLLLELRVDGVAAGRQVADRGGLGGPGACGFALALPESLYDNQPHSLAVVEAASGEALPGSPLVVRLRAGGGSVRLRRGVLEGWLDFGDRPAVRLELLREGQADPVGAPLLRPRQADPAGHFLLPLPAVLHDNTPHRLAVRDAGTGALLDAGPGGPWLDHRSALRGRLEQFSGGMLHGWAQNLADPATPLRVLLYDDDRLVAETCTAQPRPEIGAGTPGFLLPVPRALFDNAPHRLRVSLGGLDLCLGDQREIAGVLGAAEIEGAEPRFRGRLELAAPERISGWAMDTLAADRPVQVAIELDGVTIDTARADRYQPRLRSLSQHGQHGFEWPVPAECWNGRERQLTVRIIGAAEPLEGSPARLAFPSRLLPAPPGQAARLVPPPVRPAATAAAGLVSAIVLNRNGAWLLQALFASLAEHVRTPLEVVLLDHGSSDDSLAVVAQWQGRLDIRLEARGANHSFSASSNLGARLAQGEHLLFLNNDIALTHDPLPAMLRALAAPGVAAVGARLVEPVVQADGGMRPVLHHDGIGFRLLHGGDYGRSLWLPYEVEAAEADPSEGTDAVPAATAAMLLLRRADFQAMGGFDEGYDYGLEDVELCLRLGRRRGQLVVARDAVAVHQRSATRGLRFAAALADPVQAGAQGRELENRQHFLHRQGAWLKRRLRHAALHGQGGWRAERFRLGFALGEAVEDIAAASALAAALAEAAGWDAALLPCAEPDMRGLDALVAMRPETNLRQVVNATPGLLTLAWVRGEVAAWLAAAPWDACDLILAASPRMAAALRQATGRDVLLLPPATDPRRFAPQPDARLETEVLFAGPPHPAAPALLAALPEAHGTILGAGWLPGAPACWRGLLPLADQPAAYAGTRLLLNLATPEQREWALLPEQVLDAAACGTLVLTDNPAAATAWPAGLLPCFGPAEDWPALARPYLADPAACTAAAGRLREAVLAGHTYAHRAATLATALRQVAQRLRFGIKAPAEAAALGQGLCLALRQLGHGARLDLPGQWQDGIGAGDDASVVLGPAAGYEPDPRGLNLLCGATGPLPAGFHRGLPAPPDLAGLDATARDIVNLTQLILDAD